MTQVIKDSWVQRLRECERYYFPMMPVHALQLLL